MEINQRAEQFNWDRFNIDKIKIRHNVQPFECEEVFFNELYVFPDERHSQAESRYYALGMTDSGRALFVVFTLRLNRIRVISARDASRAERKIYYEKIKKDTLF